MKKYGLLSILFFILLSGHAAPPKATEVFKLSTQLVDPNTFTLNWTIEKGFFLYKSRLKLSELPNSTVHLGKSTLPVALKKTTVQGERYEVYRNQLTLTVPVIGDKPGESILKVNFQGCSDDGFCYPPQHSFVKLSVDKQLSLFQVSIDSNDQFDTPSILKRNQIIASSGFEKLFSDSSWIIIMLSFYGFGLLLAFTPCVLPMVPVLSGIIVGHGHDLSTRKAFLLSLSYVLSMSITYSIIGAVFAIMGNNLQIIMQSGWAIGLFSLLFILLALSMFDFYELRLPLSWQNKLANITRSQSSGHYLSASIMGCLSILILSPCVTAPLVGALSYIAQEGRVGLGIFSLFFLSLGMGTPLLLIGTSAGKYLPKAGQWMNEVKAFFGVLLLGVSIHLMSRLLPPVFSMMLWASLFIFSGIYLGAFHNSNTKLGKFNQSAGIILLVYGVLILVGASQGHGDPLLPLKHEKTTRLTDVSKKITVHSLNELNAALMDAKNEGKAVMVDFYADWCASCKIMVNTTLRDPTVLAALRPFNVITVDLSANNGQTQTLLNQFNLVAPPVFLFFNKDGVELKNLRLVGEISSNRLLNNLINVQKIPL